MAASTILTHRADTGTDTGTRAQGQRCVSYALLTALCTNCSSQLSGADPRSVGVALVVRTAFLHVRRFARTFHVKR